MSIEAFFLERYPTLEHYRANKDDAYAQLETHIRQLLASQQASIVFEEVGLSVHAQRLIANLRSDHPVILGKVMANRALCAQRVAQRGLTRNYPKASDMLKHVYEDFEKRSDQLYTFDLEVINCLLYTSPSPRDGLLSRMPSSA